MSTLQTLDIKVLALALAVAFAPNVFADIESDSQPVELPTTREIEIQPEGFSKVWEIEIQPEGFSETREIEIQPEGLSLIRVIRPTF